MRDGGTAFTRLYAGPEGKGGMDARKAHTRTEFPHARGGGPARAAGFPRTGAGFVVSRGHDSDGSFLYIAASTISVYAAPGEACVGAGAEKAV